MEKKLTGVQTKALTLYALTTQLLPPLMLIVLYFCFINGLLSLIKPIVDIIKIINEISEVSMSAVVEV